MRPKPFCSSEVSVEVATLDDYCAREGITPQFIKIDVEGFEFRGTERGGRDTETTSAGLNGGSPNASKLKCLRFWRGTVT